MKQERFCNFKWEKKGENAVFHYRTGMTAYGEEIKNGQYRSLGFNGSGYDLHPGMMIPNGPLPYPGMTQANGPLSDIEESCAFLLELDGCSLVSHWQLIDCETEETNGILTARVHLKHGLRPVEVTVCTRSEGSGCFSRWLEVTNLSESSAALGRLAPIGGILECTRNWRRHLNKESKSLYRLGYFENTLHLHEGQFQWHELPDDGFSFGGRYTRERHRHPFFVLENKGKGTCFAVQTAYSGGYRFRFDQWRELEDAFLAFSAEIDGVKPLRILAPGETFITPEVIVSMVNGCLDEAVQAMHTYIRKAVMRPPHGPGCYLETCSGGREDWARSFIDKAAERGFDIVYIDAEWFYKQGEGWGNWTGHWEPDPERFPNGIRELGDYCRAHGMKFGLWMEPERLGEKAGREYGLWEQGLEKDLFLQDDTGTRNFPKDSETGGFYDLGRKEAEQYVEEQICSMIESTGIDMFRLDCNIGSMPPFCFRMKDGCPESADLRYNERLYAMFSRIREKFPHVIFENCAGGGGRTDLGMVRLFDHTWVTDNPVAPRSFTITNGMTMCLPPELVDRLVTSMEAPVMASLEFQLYQLMFVRPTAHFPYDDPENPELIEKFREFMGLYKNFARPMLPTCKIYHHTPSFEGCDPRGVGILEEASENGDRAMLGVFALSDPGTEEQLVRFKGIDASARYRITAVSARESFELSGYELKYRGISVSLKAALTAELFLAERL